jgi:hypothetical protein
MVDIYIKQGDTAPIVEAVLLDANQLPVDLSGATVVFRMASRPGVAPIVDETATIVDAGAGRVSYAWAAGDTDEPGTYLAEFVVTSSEQQTFPNMRYLVVEIKPNLAAPVVP